MSKKSKKSVLKHPKTGREIIDPRTDFAFKKLFASDSEKSKRRLLSLINAILAKNHKIVGIKEMNVVNPYNMAEYYEGKESILDIKAFDENGVWYNIEIQNSGDRTYFKRALFYWSKVYGKDFNEGDEYSKLNRTIGIHLLYFNCIEPQKCIKSNRYHHKIVMRDSEIPEMKFYGMDICEIHLIELKKLNKTKIPEDTAEEWIKFFGDTVSCIKNEDQLKTEEIKEALQDLDTLNLTGKEREAYEASLKRISDQNTLIYNAEQKGREEGLKEGEQKGIKKGIEKGIEKGREEGEKNAAIKFAKSLKKEGMSTERIIKLTGLTEEEIGRIKEQ